MITLIREEKIKHRHLRIRKKISGSPERPRLAVHRSNLNLNIQVIDDYAGKTLFSVSTLSPDFRKQMKHGGNVEAAKRFGSFVAAELKKKGFQKIVFDRGGFLYHGRIKTLAESLRENGIEF